MNKLTHNQKGVSLLELMVSLAIGVILLLTLVSVYVTSSKTNKLREANEQLDETARQVFDRLEYDLNLAGYVDIFDQDPNGVNVIASKVANVASQKVQSMYGRITTDGTKPKTTLEMAISHDEVDNNHSNDSTEENQIEDINEQEDGENDSIEIPVKAFEGSDNGITIGYQVAPTDANGLASLPSSDDADNVNSGWGLDCLSQNPDPTQVRNGFVQNIYTYSTDRKEFSCNGMPLVGGDSGTDTVVEEMTFRYFITQPSNKSDVNIYNSQSGLYTDDDIYTAAEVEAKPLQWSGVTAVEVCMVVAGAPLNGQLAQLSKVQPNVPTCARNNDGYENNKPRGGGDNRLYRRYLKVFSIPNALYFTI